MWKRISKLLASTESKPKTSKEMVGLAVREIDEAVHQNKQTLQELKQNKEYITSKLEKLKAESKHLQDEAAFAVRARRDDLAEDLLRRKSMAEKQMTDYKGLIKNLSEAINQVESQIRKLELKREETKSKELVLSARMQSAKTEIEVNQHLEEFYQSTDLDSMEVEAEKLQIEAELSRGVVELDKQIEAIQEKTVVDEFKNQVEQEDQQAKQQQEAQRQKRIEQMLSSNNPKEAQLQQEKMKELEQKKLDLLNKFKTTETASPAPQKDNLLDSFFSAKEEKKEPEPQKNKFVDSFFNDKNDKSSEKEKQEQNQAPAKVPDNLKDFFNKENTSGNNPPPNNDKQKLMEDFFGKKS
jgi:phage shock protein A